MASLGLALRALGSGLRVYYLRLMKPHWKTGEFLLLPDLHPRLHFRNVEQDWRLRKSGSDPAAVEAMRQALAREMDSLEDLVRGGEYDLVIADELAFCVGRGLIPWNRVARLIAARPEHVELVFTGRDAPPEMIAAADLVTRMDKVKHPFDQGWQARRGIEF
jgi:cob(I)alamin adenosyltransferase